MIYDKIIADKMSFDINAGYWYVNNRYFFNKAECLRYATEIRNMDVRFNFFDDFYSTVDWTHEPAESLEQIYANRARQLREKYDYIVIAFTGGSDSANVVNSFLNNGLHIDEIITCYPVEVIEKLLPTFSNKDTSAANLMFEYTEAALPMLKQVAKYYPNVKISVMDYSQRVIDIVSSGNLPKLIMAGIGASPSLAGHYMLAERIREYMDKGTVACVTGIDKPRMTWDTVRKKFGMFFTDITVVWGKHSKVAFDGFIPNMEYFYYSLDMPEILQKQTAILKRQLLPIVTAEVKPHFYKDIHKKSGQIDLMQMDTDFFKAILYKNWDIKTFQAGKPSGYFYQESAEWFYKSPLTDKRTKDYHDGQILELIYGIDERMIVRDETGRPLKFVDKVSRTHSL